MQLTVCLHVPLDRPRAPVRSSVLTPSICRRNTARSLAPYNFSTYSLLRLDRPRSVPADCGADSPGNPEGYVAGHSTTDRSVPQPGKRYLRRHRRYIRGPGHSADVRRRGGVTFVARSTASPLWKNSFRPRNTVLTFSPLGAQCRFVCCDENPPPQTGVVHDVDPGAQGCGSTLDPSEILTKRAFQDFRVGSLAEDRNVFAIPGCCALFSCGGCGLGYLQKPSPMVDLHRGRRSGSPAMRAYDFRVYKASSKARQGQAPLSSRVLDTPTFLSVRATTSRHPTRHSLTLLS